MNIGVDIRPLMTPLKTGVGEYTQELLNAIFEIDKINQYFLFYNSFNDVSANIPKWQQDNVHYIATRWPNKLFNASLLLAGSPRLDKIISARTEDYRLQTTDYSHETNSRSPSTVVRSLDCFFSPNLNFTALSADVKHILTIHDLSFEFFPEFFTPRQRLWHKIINPKKQCQRADVIIAMSENTKRDIVDYYKINPKKIKVIYSGLSPTFNKFSLPLLAPQNAGQALPLGQGETVSSPYQGEGGAGSRKNEGVASITKKYNLPDNFILFLGTIEPRKNIIGLIEAFEIFNIQYPISNLFLIIAGVNGWKNKQIYDRAAKSPLNDKIKFIGYVKPNDKLILYAASSLFIYPSFYEGFGFPILEAMASGTPVITSHCSSLPEITNSAAYLINPNKPHEIAEGMARLLNQSKSSQNLRNLYIKNGLIQAAKFNWRKTAQEWLNFLPPSL